MICQPGHISFGRYLNTTRMRKGIRIQDVSQAIRIGVEMLELIEREDHARLPAETYVRGFIGAYARFIGADVETVLRSYLESRLAYTRALESEKDIQRYARRFWPNMIFSFGILILMIVLTVYLFPGSPDKGEHIKGSETATQKIAPVASNVRAADMTESSDARESIPGLILGVTAIRDTRFKVLIDHHPPEERVLRENTRVELRATESFNILLRDAGAVRMTLNQKTYPVFGSDGQQVNIQIP